MKVLSLVLLAGLLPWVPVRAGTLAERYGGQGELLLVQLAGAPFPHPQRANGHKYKEELFTAAEHYSNDTVAIFIPKGFQGTSQVDFVVHFHGWRNNVEGVLERYKLIAQLTASKRNVILVVPQGPFNAPDSFGGKLEDPDGFARFMDEVAATLRQKSSLKNKQFALGNFILSGHSGGYQVISSILDHGGLTSRVREVWLFDALYARTDKFLAWWDKYHGRLIDLYTEHGGTKQETEKLMATLKQRGTPWFATDEPAANQQDLRSNQLIFLFTTLEHDQVLEGHRDFEQFLATSCLAGLKE
jgi:hypothetical protein